MTQDRQEFGSQPTIEIERKYLVRELPPELANLSLYPSREIRQGYLASGPQGSVRLRQKGSRFFATFKSKPVEHYAQRVELETELSETQFSDLWGGTEGRRLEKTRYEIKYGPHTIELDVFRGDNEGHMLAEVEFDSTEEADDFVQPDWFGPEVTNDGKYGNSSIAEFGFPEVHQFHFPFSDRP